MGLFKSIKHVAVGALDPVGLLGGGKKSKKGNALGDAQQAFASSANVPIPGVTSGPGGYPSQGLLASPFEASGSYGQQALQMAGPMPAPMQMPSPEQGQLNQIPQQPVMGGFAGMGASHMADLITKYRMGLLGQQPYMIAPQGQKGPL